MSIEMKKDVVYRCIGSDFNNGILSCGFMPKPTKEHAQYNLTIQYYSWFILLSGSGYYDTPDGEKIPIRAGDVVQRLPGVCHSTEITPDGNWLEFFISFGRSTYDYLCSLNLLPIDHPVLKVAFDEAELQKLSRLLYELKEAPDENLPLLSLQAQALVLSINASMKTLTPPKTKNETLEEACRMLASDVHQTLSLEKIATQLHMSYENFRKLFHSYTGFSPNKYRIEQRMNHAKLMLLSGIPIKETAQLTGYSDTYAFTKQFTHSVGISPGRYKEANK